MVASGTPTLVLICVGAGASEVLRLVIRAPSRISGAPDGGDWNGTTAPVEEVLAEDRPAVWLWISIGVVVALANSCVCCCCWCWCVATEPEPLREPALRLVRDDARAYRYAD